MTVKMSRSRLPRASSSGGMSGSPYGGSHMTPELYRLSEQDVLGQDPRAPFRVDRLQVDIGDPLREPLEDLKVVTVAVRHMAGVGAQVHQRRVGVLQEALNALLRVDMGVGVRVEHQLDAVLLEE